MVKMLRVAGGSQKGRKLGSLKSLRPTEEQVRSSLFNSIGERIQDKRFLDLFAGTGVVGIEALSRGAKEAWFVDRSKSCAEVIKKNLRGCLFEERGKIFLTDARRAVMLFNKRGEKFDFIFMDPPYEKSAVLLQTLYLLGEGDLLKEEGLCVVQHISGLILPLEIGKLIKEKTKVFGATTLSFYRRKG